MGIKHTTENKRLQMGPTEIRDTNLIPTQYSKFSCTSLEIVSRIIEQIVSKAEHQVIHGDEIKAVNRSCSTPRRDYALEKGCRIECAKQGCVKTRGEVRFETARDEMRIK